jgi:serine/threonine protein kinase
MIADGDYNHCTNTHILVAQLCCCSLTALRWLVLSQALVDACDGLLFCHGGCGGAFGGGIVLHRDLKPDNILLQGVGQERSVVAALGDFGVSKLLPATSVGHGQWTTQSLKGTPGCEMPCISDVTYYCPCFPILSPTCAVVLVVATAHVLSVLAGTWPQKWLITTSAAAATYMHLASSFCRCLPENTFVLLFK